MVRLGERFAFVFGGYARRKGAHHSRRHDFPHPVCKFRHRDMRRPLGTRSSLLCPGTAGSGYPVQSLGQQRAGGQTPIQEVTGDSAVGSMQRCLCLCFGRPGRVDHRPGLLRSLPDCRERIAAGRVETFLFRKRIDHRRYRYRCITTRSD